MAKDKDKSNKDKKPDEPEADATTEEEEGGAQKPGKLKSVLLGGSVLAVVATGAIAAMMAVPGTEETPVYQGPFVASLFAVEGEDIQVNLAGSDYKRFLAMELVCEYDAFEQAYYDARVQDPHFARSVKDALIDLAGSKTAAYLKGPATHKVFLQEVRDVVEPLLFPVHIGETSLPTDTDEISGLRGGLSQFSSTFRGPLYEHVLVVDNVEKTMRVDEGPATPYEGDEENLAVYSADGGVVYIDVSRMDPEFAGEVPLGVHGRVRRILKEKFLVQ
jgi:flagellar basal body-associated protein FliL